jgi:hypothetical protein
MHMCMRCHWHQIHLCMQCHWHLMHNKIFEQLRKVKIICKTVMLWKKCMKRQWHRMHGACGVIDTACKIWHRMDYRRTIRTALAAFKGNIYQKAELSYPTPKKYINLKGLPSKKFSCMRRRWYRMHDFCCRKSIIFRQIRREFKKALARESGSQGVLLDEKNRRLKISWHCPFK